MNIYWVILIIFVLSLVCVLLDKDKRNWYAQKIRSFIGGKIFFYLIFGVLITVLIVMIVWEIQYPSISSKPVIEWIIKGVALLVTGFFYLF